MQPHGLEDDESNADLSTHHHPSNKYMVKIMRATNKSMVLL